MSSFVISKQEYVKAAGLCAGILTNVFGGYKADSISKYWYDRTLQEFVKLYNLNEKSVAEQYGDDEPTPVVATEHDEALFAEYAAKAVAMSHAKQVLLVQNLYSFFRSSLYQIEDEECETKAMRIIYTYEEAIRDAVGMHNADYNWWESIDLNDLEG